MALSISGAYKQTDRVALRHDNLWTRATYGGSFNYGRVFSISTSGALINSFDFNGTDGANPAGGLVQASDGTPYGAATKKGTASSGGAASGVI